MKSVTLYYDEFYQKEIDEAIQFDKAGNSIFISAIGIEGLPVSFEKE